MRITKGASREAHMLYVANRGKAAQIRYQTAKENVGAFEVGALVSSVRRAPLDILHLPVE